LQIAADATQKDQGLDVDLLAPDEVRRVSGEERWIGETKW
jgi:hypothetical protein